MTLTSPTGEAVDVLVPRRRAQEIVRTIQDTEIERVHETAEATILPILTVRRIDLAHRGRQSQLMVAIDQIGTVALVLDDLNLLKLRQETERAIASDLILWGASAVFPPFPMNPGEGRPMCGLARLTVRTDSP